MIGGELLKHEAVNPRCTLAEVDPCFRSWKSVSESVYVFGLEERKA